MIIDRQAFDLMLEHMIASKPSEGVGVLAGPIAQRCPRDTDGDGNCGRHRCPDCPRVERWVPLRNVSDFPALRYQVDDTELLAAWNVLEEDDLRPRVMCHSHVRSGAVPSDLDVIYAADRTLLHLVVSLQATQPVVRLWRLNPEVIGLERARRVLFEVVDLGFRTVGNSDLTRGVTGA